MGVFDDIDAFADELTAWRRDFHSYPEIGFEEVRTSGIVAEKLKSWGIETHTGIGKTGVVGVLKGQKPGRSIGLRADMDALPIQETTNLPWASKHEGVSHACGHDSHTTMLLGAARYLAQNRDFAGTAVFIFQPAEEGLGGARAMLADGLFDRFPVDEVYGLHNMPNGTDRMISVKSGTAMAGADFFDITIQGKGSHGAMPQQGHDPVVAGAALVQALQSIVSRNLDPNEAAVVSVTQFHAGSAYNVIPGEAVVSGTVRMFSDDVRNFIRRRISDICAGLAVGYNVTITPEFRNIFTTLHNDPALSAAFLDMARKDLGEDQVKTKESRATGSEDFADMLEARPGCYFLISHKNTVPLHNGGFVIDDAILPVGAGLLARIVQMRGGTI